ncbi:LPS export ABC transporter permease LptF [Tropicimonas sp. IMCC34043]|uniref:LPS export ABC transporter permease LptF n=1 Tax=Tropicimonas sp. IMCC34043 TaxID=2248760 RepID=UPI000E26FEAD|nr:LPS export ABC transporter permease LptF [Tropicimonas sp. IMCC34043]
MARFDRYFLYQLMVLFGFFSLVLVSVYWINRAVTLFDELLSDGQSAGTFFTLTLFTLPNVVRMVLPISAFVAAVYVTNRLTTESELVVAQATGMSPWRLARPVMVFGLLIALLMGLLVHVLVPVSRTLLAEQTRAIEQNLAARLLNEGQFLHPSSGLTFYVREITADNEMLDVFLSDARSNRTRTDYLARSAYLVRDAQDRPTLVMIDGTAQTLNLTDTRLTVTTFDSFSYNLDSMMEATGRGRRDVREFGTPTLFRPDAAALEATRRDPAVFLYEAHLRLAQPFNPLVAALLGFSTLMLGGYSRFGVWWQIALAIALIISLQAIENVTADIARRDTSLWPLVYVPTLLGFGVIAGLLSAAGRPSIFSRRRRQRAAA